MSNILIQWIVPESEKLLNVPMCEIEEVSSIDVSELGTFVNFKSGRSCDIQYICDVNHKIQGEHAMVIIDDKNSKWTYNVTIDKGTEPRFENGADGERVMVDPGSPDKKKYIWVSPGRSKYNNLIYSLQSNIITYPDYVPVAKEEVVQHKSTKKEVVKEQNNIQEQKDNDPIMLIYKKANKSEGEISFELKLDSLLSKEVYLFITSNFEKSEDLILNYMIENIDTKEILDVIKNKLKEYYTQ